MIGFSNFQEYPGILSREDEHAIQEERSHLLTGRFSS
jgi:hypothetical protein